MMTDLTLHELYAAVVRDDAASLGALHELVAVRGRAQLTQVYRHVFPPDGDVQAVRSVDDCIDDFLLYLYEGRPSHADARVHYYYIRRVASVDSLPAWLAQTFRHLLLEERERLRRAGSRVPMDDLLTGGTGEPQEDDEDAVLTRLRHAATGLAAARQTWSADDFYVLMRSLGKHLAEGHAPAYAGLTDAEVAQAMGMEHAALRQRTSRACRRLQALIRQAATDTAPQPDWLAVRLVEELCTREYAVDYAAVVRRLHDEAEAELPEAVRRALDGLRGGRRGRGTWLWRHATSVVSMVDELSMAPMASLGADDECMEAAMPMPADGEVSLEGAQRFVRALYSLLAG